MKILIFTKNWLGDILFQLPAIEAIAKQYPEAGITCAAPKRCKDILEAHPAIHEVLVFDEKNEHRSLFAKWKFLKSIRQKDFSHTYFLHRSRTRACLAWLAGIRERIGYRGKRSFFLTKAVKEPQNPNLHQVGYYLYLMEEAGIPVSVDARYRFYFSKQALKFSEQLFERHGLKENEVVCFHLGANWEPKRWPPENFAILADAIDEKWHLPIVVTGAKRDEVLFKKLKSRVKKARVVSLIGNTNLEELGAFYSKISALVTGDSGPMHIASGAGAPVLALFGPTDPNLTGPRGVGPTRILSFVPQGYHVPWYKKEFPESGWLSNLSPQTVLKAINEEGWLKPSSKIAEAPSAPTKQTFQGSHLNHEKNLLFVTLSNIGDVVLSLPTLMALKELYPNVSVTVVADPKAVSVLRGSQWIDEVVEYNKRDSLFNKVAFILKLRQKKYEVVVDLRNSAIPFLVSAKKRSPVFRRFAKMSMRERHLEVLSMMGLAAKKGEKFDFYGSAEELHVANMLKEQGIEPNAKFILIAPAAASELKSWPIERFKVLAGMLLESFDLPLVLTGDAREGEIAEELVAVNPGRIFNLGGRTSIREAAALIRHSQLLISNDSALMHIGFELNHPVIALFGPTDPLRYGHAGKNFRLLRSSHLPEPNGETIHCGDRNYFFRDLTPEIVLKTVKEFLRVGEAVK